MPLGPKLILKLVKEKKLVENLAERELTNPEGAGFDLRVGEIYMIKGKSFLGVTERKTPDIKLLSKYKKGSKTSYTFEPGKYYLVRTMEKLNLPDDIEAYLYTRGTLIRSGIIHVFGQTAPGYSGSLVVGLYNAGPCKVQLELGARFMHVQFEYVEGGGSSYRGQWKGGRVTTVGKERQV